jgi:hypothetical protein
MPEGAVVKCRPAKGKGLTGALPGGSFAAGPAEQAKAGGKWPTNSAHVLHRRETARIEAMRFRLKLPQQNDRATELVGGLYEARTSANFSWDDLSTLDWIRSLEAQGGPKSHASDDPGFGLSGPPGFSSPRKCHPVGSPPLPFPRSDGHKLPASICPADTP